MNTRAIQKMLLMALLWSGNQSMAAEWLEPLEKGHEAAGFELKDLEGKTHSLSDYKGKVLLVNFWASWCNSCIREFPSLERLSRGMDTRRFALLAVNAREGKGTVQRYGRLQDAGIQILMDRDGKVTDNWGVNVYPTSFIVDANGNILGNVIGETDWDSEDKHTYIKSLFADKAGE